jgi:hypothetical protein
MAKEDSMTAVAVLEDQEFVGERRRSVARP